MKEVLESMWLISPIVLAMMACVAIGFAVTAREALGRERGLREAREQAHEDEELALTFGARQKCDCGGDVRTDVDVAYAEFADEVFHHHGNQPLVFDDKHRTYSFVDLDMHAGLPFRRHGPALIAPACRTYSQ